MSSFLQLIFTRILEEGTKIITTSSEIKEDKKESQMFTVKNNGFHISS